MTKNILILVPSRPAQARHQKGTDLPSLIISKWYYHFQVFGTITVSSQKISVSVLYTNINTELVWVSSGKQGTKNQHRNSTWWTPKTKNRQNFGTAEMGKSVPFWRRYLMPNRYRWCWSGCSIKNACTYNESFNIDLNRIRCLTFQTELTTRI